jgi:hypothetical protein
MTRSRQASVLAALLALTALFAAACGGGGTSQQRTLTERERDSTLGKSAIPGGAAVTRALATSDSMAARAARQNSAAQGAAGQ